MRVDWDGGGDGKGEGGRRTLGRKSRPLCLQWMELEEVGRWV